MEEMLEAKYFRDYKRSYLILPCNLALPDRNYQCKLLTAGKFEEMLYCSLRHVNGAAYFYYDISSRTTLESLYRGRQFSFRQVRELFEQLYGIYTRLGDYFMDETKLVLLPEYIYYDLSRKKYIGLYYPDYEEEKPYETLMDYLLEHMDSQDERLADVIYQIYERSEENTFSLHDALQRLGEQEENDASEKIETEERETGKITDFMSDMDSLSLQTVSFGDDSDLTGENLRKEAKRQSPEPERKNRFSVFLIALSVLGLAGIACIYGFYELSDEEMMTLFGCGALMGVCLLAGLVGALKNGGKKEERKEAAKPFLQKEDCLSAAEEVSLEGVLCREAEAGLHMSVKTDEDYRPALARRSVGDERLEEREVCGNTVFFDSAKMMEYKLYALDRKNKRHIELIKFPYTVGKMAGCVDCLLTDDSVSRIHARFEKEGDTIRLVDMNSTNGTYKNGLRLQPQESVDIEPGDEIRFGNLNYCYR
ncbi:MAG: FHA domain-containing protein [Lachnospiraceae bacterium]|nr:FHA domain-containing protein [Lachnospiraceae bacterium]